jgi:hypothetical protein
MKLRFSIRDLFWLMLVVALAAGWWLDRHQSYKEKLYWRIEQINGTTVITNVQNGYKKVVRDGEKTSFLLPAEIESMVK